MSVANRPVSLHAVVAQFVASIVHGFGVIKGWLDWGKYGKIKCRQRCPMKTYEYSGSVLYRHRIVIGKHGDQ